MLFINYAVLPERLRQLVPQEFELDLRSEGEAAFVSAVAFRNENIKAGVLPLPDYDQINYRAYITGGEGAAVYFFDMNINSRVVATGTNFLGLPVGYEEIEILAEAEKESGSKEDIRLSVSSSGAQGLSVEAIVRMSGVDSSPDPPTEFFTERPVGYVKAPAGGILRVTVEHEKIAAVCAQTVSARAPFFESLGILNEEESQRPHSVLYARESLFNTSPPALMLV